MGLAVREARAARVYLVEAAWSAEQAAALRVRLLADPVVEECTVGAAQVEAGWSTVEIHPLPGVMDPAAQSVREAAADLLGEGGEIKVSTGRRFDVAGVTGEQALALARGALANPLIHEVRAEAWTPESLPVGRESPFEVRTVAIRELPDAELAKFSRDAHLFLSLEEMIAVREEYRRIGRDPTDVELETIAQTWSEHCVHKTLKSRIRYRGGVEEDSISWEGRPGHHIEETDEGPVVVIDNLLKSTVAAATHELIEDGVDWTLSVFKDNSGVIALDEAWGICVKVETHNHPSALEPYGGAATGIGGCIRDVIGTGLGAKPIASTDVFCVASPDFPAAELPPGTIHPRRVLSEVVAGVRDYGNRMGIPTVTGAVYFDDRYVGNPLVFCGCIGLIPRDRVHGKARPGDRIVALGGRTGRDGIHGATFSSAELEQTHGDEFAHAVQIGNAIEEKRLLDAVLRARDAEGGPLYTAITDCGAGGFSSAIGEMGSELGAAVELDRAPLKYAGLTYTEVWISEAQERMVLAVPAANMERLRAICAEERVELADLGEFEPTGELVLRYRGKEVGRLSMRFLHEGIPTPTREAEWFVGREMGEEREESAAPRPTPAKPRVGFEIALTPNPSAHGAPKAVTPLDAPRGRASSEQGHASSPVRAPADRPPAPPFLVRGPGGPAPTVQEALLKLLAHPTIASKHWIVRQYDHEVQGNTVVKPLVGPASRGPGDAAIIEPVAGSGRGVAIACGLQVGVGDVARGGDPYQMALAGIDECVRNLVCIGANPLRIALLDNFCFPSCERPENLGALVRAAEGCYDGAMAYRAPFVSGKDSLNNQLKYTDASGVQRLVEIPPTLLITGIGLVPSIRRALTMDAKRAGNVLVLLGVTTDEMGGSLYSELDGASGEARAPRVDLSLGPRLARAVHELITQGIIVSAHDASEGGMLVAAAEMLIAAAPAEPGARGGGGSGLDDLLAGRSVRREARALGLEMTISHSTLTEAELAFAESPSRYIVEVDPAEMNRLKLVLRDLDAQYLATIGTLNESGRLVWAKGGVDVRVEELARAWLGTLNW